MNVDDYYSWRARQPHWSTGGINGKRSRDEYEYTEDYNEPGPSQPRPASSSTFTIPVTNQNGDAAKSMKQIPNTFRSFSAFMDAFKTEVQASMHDLDFSGTFLVLNEPEISDKERVRLMGIELWRATGYRFTIKDHPHLRDGHKTRFWCSQDEAGKNKESERGKTRYICRSSLLISSKVESDDNPDVRFMTVRFHHHLAHEHCSDAELPSFDKTLWKEADIAHNPSPRKTPKRPPRTRRPKTAAKAESPSPAAAVGQSHPSIATYPLPPPYNSITHSYPTLPAPSPPKEQRSLLSRIKKNPFLGVLAPQPPKPPEPSPPPEDLPPDAYRKRMRFHIQNIREFCDGLEYQLQFNDQRLLRALEKDGESFLKLVHKCLQNEGRYTERENHRTGAGEQSSRSSSMDGLF